MKKLTDLEICKRIAEIEGYKTSVTDRAKGVWASVYENNCYDWFNPLTDDALCFRLMIKYELIVGKAASGWSVYTDSIANFIVNDNNPNRAICLAIIEANKENNQNKTC